MSKGLLLFLLLAGLSGCDWFSRGGPPAQDKFEREEIFTHHNEAGFYLCTKCGAVLFGSDKKIKNESARWPIFSQGESGAVRAPSTSLTKEDQNKRVCAKCGLHIGHLCRNAILLPAGEVASDVDICALSSSLKFAGK